MSATALGESTDTPVVAFFDVDNTLMRGASLFHIAKAARRIRLITLRDILRFAWHQTTFIFIGENLNHVASIKDRALELMGGHTETELLDLATEVFDRDIERRLWPQTLDLARQHLADGHQVWLISATPRIIGAVIAERLGLTGALGTEFVTKDGVFTGGFAGEVLHAETKAVAARALATKLGAVLADCWAYSDSRNDIPLLTLVGHPMVVNPDSRLAKHAKALSWPIMRFKRSTIKDARKKKKRQASRPSA